MRDRYLPSLGALAAALVIGSLASMSVVGQSPTTAATTKTKATAGNWTAPRTAWGHPDLQGVWDPTTGTPLERPADLAGKEFLTDQEAAERERKRFQDFDNPNRSGN